MATISENIKLLKKDIKEIKRELRFCRIDLWLYRLDRIKNLFRSKEEIEALEAVKELDENRS